MNMKITDKELEALGIEFVSPSHPIYNRGSMTLFINRSGTTTPMQSSSKDSNLQTPVDPNSSTIQPSEGTNEMNRGGKMTPLNNELPDLQNLPFDPAEVALENIAKTAKRLGKKG